LTVRVPFKRIGITEARALVARPDLLLLDMREAKAHASASIGSSRHVTEANIHEFISRTSRTRPVLIYCHHGNASQVYAQTFADFGFSDVYSLDGGFEAWREAMTHDTLKPAKTDP
jgi:thiosulfate/3-mercaptopyruvate sulfurtransferase